LPHTGGSDAHTLGEIGLVKISCKKDPIEGILSGDVEIHREGIKRLISAHAQGLFKRKIMKK